MFVNLEPQNKRAMEDIWLCLMTIYLLLSFWRFTNKSYTMNCIVGFEQIHKNYVLEYICCSSPLPSMAFHDKSWYISHHFFEGSPTSSLRTSARWSARRRRRRRSASSKKSWGLLEAIFSNLRWRKREKMIKGKKLRDDFLELMPQKTIF